MADYEVLLHFQKLRSHLLTYRKVSWYSIFGIATCCGLDSPRIKYWYGERFSATIQTAPGAHPASYTMGSDSISGVM
jgi:hypothetical protein